MENDAMKSRMKRYEESSKTFLTPRMPVIIRLDGKAFKTFTKGFKKPFDPILTKAMQKTMQSLCEDIQGCVLGYTQSDEISLVLVDYKKLDTSPWFDYNVQKCASIAASMATLAFNRFLMQEAYKVLHGDCKDEDYLNNIRRACAKGAMFDARVFNVPKEDVTNNILWRQNDASRNSVEMLGRAYFSQSDLHKKSNSQIQDMLMNVHGVNWNDLPIALKRGSCCKRVVCQENGVLRGKWAVDQSIPVFKGEDRDYIDSLVFVGD